MRNTILIADADEASREILAELFEENYEITEAENGASALNIIKKDYEKLAAVILDLDLGDMSGVDMLSQINQAAWFEAIPFIVMSNDFSLKNEKAVYKAGATEFRRKPFDSNLIKSKVSKLIELYTVREKLDYEVLKNKDLESKSVSANESSKAKVSEDPNSPEAVTYREMHNNMIQLIGQMVELRNPENRNHVRRMKGLVKIMGDKLASMYPEYNLTPEKVDIIVTACSIHDIGKTAIPDAVLLKPGRFTDEEYEYMKSHTLRGIELLDMVRGTWSSEYDEIIRHIVRSHHEKYDGGGYPDGLKGDDIPVEAQLISIADTYDALVNDRIYKKAYPKDVAFNMINVGECGVFPPKMLECFKECREQLEAWENGELSLGIR